MSKKRIVAVIATVAVVAGLFAGCGSSSAPKQGSSGTTKQITVGLSTDEGGLNDKSFNQAADTGIKKAVTDFGIKYSALESKSKDDYESNLDALVAQKSDLVFGVGYQMEQAMDNEAKKYSNTKFAIIDTVVNEPNVESIGFKEQEGSFLMGVIAGKMANGGKIGFIGGQDSELINKFEAGFAAGVKAVNPTAAADLMSRSTVIYVNSFNDTNAGYEAANTLINKGCTVIYHAAGGVGIGMFKAVKEANDKGKKVWAIGVDMDQAVSVPEYASVILSSMVKRVDTATYDAVKDLKDGKFKAGQSISLGLKEDGVGVAPSSSTNTPKDVLDLVNKYADAIKADKITVPTKPADVKNFTVPAVQ